MIGDIDDMSGPYADVIGSSGVESIKMAIADFGGSVLGQPIQILTFDHQNKPALGAEKLREWADTDGMTMLLGGSNTGVSLAMSAAAKEKKVPFFAIGAAGASLTGKDCTPYTIHYGYDTTALSNGTAKTILEEGGKSWFFITADYAFGKQLEAGATEVVKAGGGTVIGNVRVPLGTSDFSSYLLQAQSSGAQVLGARQRRHGHVELAQGGGGIRPDQDDAAGSAARLPFRRSRAWSRNRSGPRADDLVVLEHERHN